MKDFDTFSFKPENSQSSKSEPDQDSQIPTFSKIDLPKNEINWRDLNYRLDKPKNAINDFNYSYKNQSRLNETLPLQKQIINEKILRMDKEISENIKRRIDLENKLYRERQEERERLNEEYFRNNFVKTPEEVGKLFGELQQKHDYIQSKINKQKNKSFQNTHITKRQDLSETLRIPQQHTLPIESVFKPNFSKTKKINKPQVEKLLPNQLKIQNLLTTVTFPELPSKNLEVLEQQIQQIAIHSEHSDVIYLQMVINFHLRRYLKVRKFFKEIQGFKIYEKKAIWIAAEAQFELEEYGLCLRLTDQCLKSVSKKEINDYFLPRFLFLSARCYEATGDFIKSIVCYNQLIKIRPKIADFRLQRGLIYDKIGYPEEAKEDILTYSQLQPEAFVHLKEKIMIEQNQIKRKELIKALAKLS